jgi:hypothetical protein
MGFPIPQPAAVVAPMDQSGAQVADDNDNSDKNDNSDDNDNR